MAIQDFTAGQVLTAAQMDSLQANDYNWTVSTKTASYVLTATDKGTRVVMNAAGATTITVNTSLFAAGDTLYLQNIGAGVCTVTAGTATVTSAGPLAIPQWGSGILYFTSASAAVYFPSAATTTNPALVCVKAETTASAVTSATADSVFTSTYTNYLIISKFSTSSTQAMQLKFRASGTSTSTNYNRQRLSGAGLTASAAQEVNQTQFGVDSTNGATNFALSVLNITSPQLATKTIFTNTVTNNYANYTTGLEVGLISGNQNSDTQFDGIEFLVASGTFTITYTIYGYSKTV